MDELSFNSIASNLLNSILLILYASIYIFISRLLISKIIKIRHYNIIYQNMSIPVHHTGLVAMPHENTQK